MSGPLVSVLLSSRNGARYLAESLRSLALQTYEPMEIVAVDDGSTDETGAILAAFAATRPGVRLLRTEGIGLAAALAVAAREATGTLLARQDDDDRSRPDRIERQVRHLEEHPGDAIVGSAATVLDAAGVERAPYPVPIGEAAIRRALRRATPFVHGSVLMRREAYEAAGGYRAPFRASQDYDLWLRLPREGGLANLPEPLYAWRAHPGGVFARARGDQIFFAALARAFAEERRATGRDSIELLAEAGSDAEAFAARYRRRDRLALVWAETLLRDGRTAAARRRLGPAFRAPRSVLRALVLWQVTWLASVVVPARRARVRRRLETREGDAP